MTTNRFASYFLEKRQELENEFAQFISFKTISCQKDSLQECIICAQWIQSKLEALGFTTSLWGDNFPPTVFGTVQGKSDKTTLLLYNHYDVQPVDPLPEWKGDPFTLISEGDRFIARGAQDNKGQAFYCLTALSAIHDLYNGFPCSIKVLMEGEEEVGSAHLGQLLQEHSHELKANYAMIIDLGMRAPDRPAITLGTRGLITMTLEVIGPNQDLHSGTHGGIAHNPLHALIEILAKARDPNGRITIPGFYDDIESFSDDFLNKLSLHFDEEAYETLFGQAPTGGEKTLKPFERNWLQPTFEINGITGGYGGPGSKTVIPSRAMAKISCRLVPGQDPPTIAKHIQQFVESHAPKGISVQLTVHKGWGKATRGDPFSPCAIALSHAMKEVFHTDPEFILEGASIAAIPEIQEASGADLVMWGLGLSTDKIHAPNEEFDWKRMQQGFETLCRTIQLLSEKP